MVPSSDKDTDFFGIVTGILQGNTSTLYVVIFCSDLVFGTSVHLIKRISI